MMRALCLLLKRWMCVTVFAYTMADGKNVTPNNRITRIDRHTQQSTDARILSHVWFC